MGVGGLRFRVVSVGLKSPPQHPPACLLALLDDHVSEGERDCLRRSMDLANRHECAPAMSKISLN